MALLPLQTTFGITTATVQQVINFYVWLFNSMWAAVQYVVNMASNVVGAGEQGSGQGRHGAMLVGGGM